MAHFHGMKACFTLLALLVLLTSSGCATVFNGGRDRVQIYSVSGVRRVRELERDLVVQRTSDNTAYEVRLDPHSEHHLLIETGRATHSVTATRSVGAGWVVLDVLCHPLICVLVDAISGAWTGFDAIYLMDPPAGASVQRAPAQREAPRAPPPPPSGPTVLAPITVTPWGASEQQPR